LATFIFVRDRLGNDTRNVSCGKPKKKLHEFKGSRTFHERSESGLQPAGGRVWSAGSC